MAVNTDTTSAVLDLDTVEKLRLDALRAPATTDQALMERVLTGLRRSLQRDRAQLTCAGGCNTPDAEVLTGSGYCVTCAINACDSGDGDLVGLPTPANDVAAANAFEKHITTCPSDTDRTRACLVCALARRECPECRTDSAVAPTCREHLIVRGFVLVGCEGYVTPAARAAALLT